MEIELPHAARDAESVVIVRNPSVTHIVDGDQRTVELPIVVARRQPRPRPAPADANVAPPGPYMLFVNRRTPDGLIPSKARQIFVGVERCPVISADDGNDD